MSKKIVVVGVGALGSHTVQFLRNLDVDFTVIDFDRIEAKNVQSQFHAKPSTGKFKTAALQQTMHFLFGTKIEAVPHRLTTDNVKELLNKADLVIDALDNGPSRKLVQDYAVKEGIPCVHGALAADGAFGRSVWTDKFKIDETAVGGATCENGEHLPFVVITAAYIAKSVQEFIKTGKKIGFEISPFSVFCT